MYLWLFYSNVLPIFFCQILTGPWVGLYLSSSTNSTLNHDILIHVYIILLNHEALEKQESTSLESLTHTSRSHVGTKKHTMFSCTTFSFPNIGKRQRVYMYINK